MRTRIKHDQKSKHRVLKKREPMRKWEGKMEVKKDEGKDCGRKKRKREREGESEKGEWTDKWRTEEKERSGREGDR